MFPLKLNLVKVQTQLGMKCLVSPQCSNKSNACLLFTETL